MNIEHKNWYVVHAPDTKIQELARKLGGALGEENVLFPTAKDRKLNRRKNEYIEKDFPLYFNYIFVKLGAIIPSDGSLPLYRNDAVKPEESKKIEAWLQETVNSHIKIMCHPETESWVKLSESEINNIRDEMHKAKEDPLELECNYGIGDKVKILKGPFRFFNGIVSDFNRNRKKVFVQVFVFGREVPVEEDMEGVEKLVE